MCMGCRCNNLQVKVTQGQGHLSIHKIKQLLTDLFQTWYVGKFNVSRQSQIKVTLTVKGHPMVQFS